MIRLAGYRWSGALAGAVIFIAPLLSPASAHDLVLWLSPSSHIRNATKAFERGDIGETIRLSRLALDGDLATSDRFNAHNILCVSYIRLKLFETAIDACDAALVVRRDWRALNNRANAYFEMGRYDNAIADYRSALKLAPGRRVLVNNLALAEDRRDFEQRHGPGKRGIKRKT